MDSSFADRVVLVTGGARGIGAAIARGIVAAGGSVVVADVLSDEVDALVAELGERARGVTLDVNDAGDWEAALKLTHEAFGPLTGLVNNAGILAMGPIDGADEAEFRRVLDVNVTGVWLGMRAAIPSMREAGGGSIVNISSTAGMIGYAYLAPYVASKWAVRGMTKTAAMELAREGIRVNSVHPGPIRTPMTDGIGDEMTLTQPIPRFGEPDEVAAMVLFLLSDASSYSTGSEFLVDGGQVLGPVNEALG